MNRDHTDDNLLITRAFGGATENDTAEMTGFDGDGGHWIVRTRTGAERAVTVPWPGRPITQRPDVRREVVALYDLACARLEIKPRPHG